MHGDEVCRSLIHERPGTRLLLLTAASTVQDRISGLELGADDYLPKPFVFGELVARVRALGRRSTWRRRRCCAGQASPWTPHGTASSATTARSP